MEVPLGETELILRFNHDAVHRPILRKCTKAKGVTDEPMPKSAFLDIHEANMKNAGYLNGTSIHAIRRGLGKKVDGEIPTPQGRASGSPWWPCRLAETLVSRSS